MFPEIMQGAGLAKNVANTVLNQVNNNRARRQADQHFYASQAQQQGQFDAAQAQQQAQFAESMGLQRDKLAWNQHMAQNQMTYKMQDAMRAGIHPSVAAGAAPTGMPAPSGGVQAGSAQAGSGHGGAAHQNSVMMDARMLMDLQAMQASIDEARARAANYRADTNLTNANAGIAGTESEFRERVLQAGLDDIASQIENRSITNEQIRANTQQTLQDIEHDRATHEQVIAMMKAELARKLHDNEILLRRVTRTDVTRPFETLMDLLMTRIHQTSNERIDNRNNRREAREMYNAVRSALVDAGFSRVEVNNMMRTIDGSPWWRGFLDFISRPAYRDGSR